MKPARLILIRHGQTASNGGDPNPRMSGWADLPLSPTGRQQAEALHQRFLSEPQAAALYSSPLQRTRDTAQRLAHASLAPLRIWESLQEINCGAVDGWPITEVQKRFPQYWEENLRQENADFRWPGGESYRELRARSLTALNTIASAHPGERVLVVTHAGLISQVLGWLHGLSPAQWEPYRPGNTSLTELEWSETTARLIVFNDHSHLHLLAQSHSRSKAA